MSYYLVRDVFAGTKLFATREQADSYAIHRATELGREHGIIAIKAMDMVGIEEVAGIYDY